MTIIEKKWAALPSCAKSVYPVIACHCDRKGECFPSRRTIAIMSGCTETTAGKGIACLEGYPGYESIVYFTNRGNRSRRYKLKFPERRQKGEAFIFRKMVVEGGNWRQLTPSSRAVYPVMRCFGFFDQELYAEYATDEEDEEEYYGNEFWSDPKAFLERRYDFCQADQSLLAELSGITRKTLPSALKNLEDNFLVQRIDENMWKVFLKPPRYYTREWINGVIADKYH